MNDYPYEWQHYSEYPTVLFHETIGNNQCLVSTVYDHRVDLYMRSRTGRWTHVQGFGRASQANTFVIDKASNFKAPAPAMQAFLQACMEAL